MCIIKRRNFNNNYDSSYYLVVFTIALVYALKRCYIGSRFYAGSGDEVKVMVQLLWFDCVAKV